MWPVKSHGTVYLETSGLDPMNLTTKNLVNNNNYYYTR